MRLRAILLAFLAGVACAGAAQAEGETWIAPLKTDLPGGWTASLSADANLTGYGAWQSGHDNTSGATASLFFMPKIEKLFANEWRLGFAGTIDAYHDTLSGDNYGNRTFAKAYVFVDTPIGDLELGQQDGAAYKMAITGPLIGGAAAIDDANITFFRDPLTGANLRNIFDIRTAVFATGNDAKISLYTPRLLGLQLGVSYTPGLVRDVIPFVGTAPHVADRQSDLVDAAINYTGDFGRTALAAYAGLAAGHNAQASAGHDDLLDWALGGEVDYDLNVATLALGGAYRQTNAYDFDPYNAVAHGATRAVHASATLSAGPWRGGLEYSDGKADAAFALPALGFTGYELSAGYVVNDNLQFTAGWQHERYTRSTGSFYTGSRTLDLDAAFLYARVHI